MGSARALARRGSGALAANPDSDDVKFDLANAYFRKGLYAEALDAAQQVSASGQQDDTYLALLGDIYAHLGNQARSVEIFQDAIRRNPENDQYYLSLTLIELRANDVSGAEETLNIRGERSVTCKASLCVCRAPSIQVLSPRLVTSITSVSPSQRPTESPSQKSMPSRCSRGSVCTMRWLCRYS